MRIPSESGSEKAVLLRVEQYATKRNLSCTRDYLSDDRWNLFINWDTDTEVVFSTHLDVVPPQIETSQKNGILYGRGACDAKGIAASMLAAGEEIQRNGGAPAYLFVCGEEVDSCGAKKAAKSGRKTRFLVNGEPTRNTFVSAHKGVLGYSLKAKGTSAHSAFPEYGESAVDALLDVIHAIRNEPWKMDETLGSVTTNIGRIRGGIAPNVIPDAAECTIMHRIVEKSERYKEKLNELIPAGMELMYFAQSDPQSMYVPDGETSTTVAFGTDIPYLRAMGTPVLIGPGDIMNAHTDHECILVSELEDAVRIYKNLYFQLRREAND